MVQVIRNQIFETNSSSEHSLTLSKKDEIKSLIQDIEDIIDNFNYVSELYSTIGKIEHLKEILMKEIYEIKEDY